MLSNNKLLESSIVQLCRRDAVRRIAVVLSCSVPIFCSFQNHKFLFETIQPMAQIFVQMYVTFF